MYYANVGTQGSTICIRPDYSQVSQVIDCVLVTEANHLNTGNFLPPGNQINLLCSPEETPEETLVPERNKKSSEIHFQKKRP